MVTFLKKWNSTGTGHDGNFNRPEDMAFGNSDTIYVADTGNNRIIKFDSEFNFIKQWGSEGTS